MGIEIGLPIKCICKRVAMKDVNIDFSNEVNGYIIPRHHLCGGYFYGDGLKQLKETSKGSMKKQ